MYNSTGEDREREGGGWGEGDKRMRQKRNMNITKRECNVNYNIFYLGIISMNLYTLGIQSCSYWSYNGK